MRPRPDAYDPERVLPVVIKEQSLSASLAFVVTRSESNGIYIPPVRLLLRMDAWIPVYFAGRCLEYLRFDALRQPEHVDCPVNACLGRLDGIELVMNRRCGASQVKNLVHFSVQRECNIVPQ